MCIVLFLIMLFKNEEGNDKSERAAFVCASLCVRALSRAWARSIARNFWVRVSPTRSRRGIDVDIVGGLRRGRVGGGRLEVAGGEGRREVVDVGRVG